MNLVAQYSYVKAITEDKDRNTGIPEFYRMFGNSRNITPIVPQVRMHKFEELFKA